MRVTLLALLFAGVATDGTESVCHSPDTTQ